MDNKGLLTDGRCANKHLAVVEYNAAKDALVKLDQLFAGNYSGPGGLGAKVMKQLFIEITTIPTGLEGPWLSPAWQLQFQYVCLIGSIVMEKLSPFEKK